MKRKHTKSAREIKEDRVTALEDKVKRAKTITFADYRGLGANQINELRDKIKEAGGELTIEKNSLLKIALKNTNHKLEDEKLLTGPTAAIFAFEDEIAALKQAADLNKTLGIPTFKFGFFASDFLDAGSVEKLSKIPPKNVLQGKLVSTISSPLYGIVSVLQANIKNLVSVLDQAAKKGVTS